MLETEVRQKLLSPSGNSLKACRRRHIMLSLNEVASGRSCSVIWLIGALGTLLEQHLSVNLEDSLQMVLNLGEDGVIVSKGGRRFAMDSATAHAIKVELLY